MPTSTYDLIASNVLTSSASSVTFSSIPATYRDLVLVVNAIATSGGDSSTTQINSDTGSNYSMVRMSGNGSTASSSSGTTTRFDLQGLAIADDGRTLITMQFLDYSATDKHKTVLFRGNKSNAIVLAAAGRWASTSAITSIYFAIDSGTMASGSTFYLYGIVS